MVIEYTYKKIYFYNIKKLIFDRRFHTNKISVLRMRSGT